MVQALFESEIRPMVWVSDMLGSQRGHAAEWQVCLAHLLRDATYAIECGDTAFSAAFKRLLLRAIAIGRRRDELKDITLTQYLARPRSPAQSDHGSGSNRRKPGRKLRKRIAANRGSPCSSSSPIGACRIPTTCPKARHLPPQRDIPQGDQRIPLRVGSRNLCRLPGSLVSTRKGQQCFSA